MTTEHLIRGIEREAIQLSSYGTSSSRDLAESLQNIVLYALQAEN